MHKFKFIDTKFHPKIDSLLPKFKEILLKKRILLNYLTSQNE